MNITPEWLQAVPLSFAGTGYAPVVLGLLFGFVAARMLRSIARALTDRHTITVAHWVWALVIQANTAFRRARPHAPASGRRRARSPYVALAFYRSMGVGHILSMVIAVVCLCVFLARGTWGLAIATTLCLAWFMGRACLDWAAVSWARHSITTGEAFTWPQRRAP